MSAELQRALDEFRSLNRRRLFGTPPLEVAELERWGELRERLGEAFAGDGSASREQRESLRLPTHLKVVFETGDELREAFLENISEGGIFIVTARPLVEGTPVRLRIVADGLSVFEAPGRVRWTRARGDEIHRAGMGIEFEQLSDETREQLDSLLAQVVRAL